MVVKIDISIAINIMDFAFAPIQMIISGPKETFGREFKTVKYGSKTLAMNLFDQSILAINIPIILDNVKLIIVSYSVTNMCDVRSLLLNNDIIVFKTRLGDDDKNLFSIPYFAPSSQKVKNNNMIIIFIMFINTFSFFLFLKNN